MNSSVLVLVVHPRLEKSRVNRVLFERIKRLEGLTVRPLYDLYPDFYIDVPFEQHLLDNHQTIVFQHPVYWYSAPSLLKEWMDAVLVKGYAYAGGSALKGKRWLSVLSCGGNSDAYGATGQNRFTMEELMRPFEQTANLCGMHYLPPLIMHGAERASEDAIERFADQYVLQLKALSLAKGQDS